LPALTSAFPFTLLPEKSVAVKLTLVQPRAVPEMLRFAGGLELSAANTPDTVMEQAELDALELLEEDELGGGQAEIESETSDGEHPLGERMFSEAV
jgi:hypothetical protein